MQNVQEVSTRRYIKDRYMRAIFWVVNERYPALVPLPDLAATLKIPLALFDRDSESIEYGLALRFLIEDGLIEVTDEEPVNLQLTPQFQRNAERAKRRRKADATDGVVMVMDIPLPAGRIIKDQLDRYHVFLVGLGNVDIILTAEQLLDNPTLEDYIEEEGAKSQDNS